MRDVQEPGRREPAPADVQVPPLPPAQRGGKPVLPQSRALERNSVVADRFTAEGQRVQYHFQAEGGELSIFDLGTWGYARGWRSTARVRIVDASGEALVDEQRSGDATYRHFLCFVAPRRGRYVYQLSAVEETFRYVLIRHSDYRDHGPEGLRAIPAGSTLVHDYLRGAGDSARFSLPLAAGDRVGVKVRNTQEEARAAHRAGRGEEVADWPRFALQVEGVDRAARAASHFALLRAEEDGVAAITVQLHGEGVGGLFDLVLERDVPLVRVHGVIIDGQDRPRSRVRLVFLREPDLDPVGQARTGPRGRYEIEVPPGPYRIVLGGGDANRERTVETNVLGDRELNAIL